MKARVEERPLVVASACATFTPFFVTGPDPRPGLESPVSGCVVGRVFGRKAASFLWVGGWSGRRTGARIAGAEARAWVGAAGGIGGRECVFATHCEDSVSRAARAVGRGIRGPNLFLHRRWRRYGGPRLWYDRIRHLACVKGGGAGRPVGRGLGAWVGVVWGGATGQHWKAAKLVGGGSPGDFPWTHTCISRIAETSGQKFGWVETCAGARLGSADSRTRGRDGHDWLRDRQSEIPRSWCPVFSPSFVDICAQKVRDVSDYRFSSDPPQLSLRKSGAWRQQLSPAPASVSW